MKRKLTFLLPSLLLLTVGLFAQGVDPGTANLIHSWTFDDGTANDVVGVAHGTLMGEAVIENGALVTADLNQYVELPADLVALNECTEFTCEIWFQSFAGLNAGYHMFFYFGDSKNNMGYNGFFLTPARGDNKSRAAISCWADTPYQGETGADGPEYDDGEIHHMVATLNYTDIALFVDGVETGRKELSALNKIDALGPIFCYLAKGGYAADPTWRGTIFEFNIFDRVLTADEILFLASQDPTGTAVREHPNAGLPKGYELHQNYPNPFNPSTTISFDLQKKSKVHITVCDMLGHPVAELLNEVKDAGPSSVQFDGSNLSDGMYVCKMQVDGKQVSTKKMMLLK
jgi:hypothetical protein